MVGRLRLGIATGTGGNGGYFRRIAGVGDYFYQSIGGERVRVHLAVLTLGYSRRLLVRAFRSEKQDHWLQTLEEGFRHWGGVPQEVLVDNAGVPMNSALEALNSWGAPPVRW